jgi:ribosomal protein S12 methylthiotransferase
VTFLEAVRFDHVGVFTYSHEEGTSAYGLADDVPAAVKKKRQSRLMTRQKQIVARQQKRRIGERTRLLVDGPSPQHELVLRGRLEGQAPDVDPQVYLTDADPETLRAGAFLEVEIVGADGYDLVARPV